MSWYNFCPKQPDPSLKLCSPLNENEHSPVSSFEMLKVAPGCPWLSSWAQSWISECTYCSCDLHGAVVAGGLALYRWCPHKPSPSTSRDQSSSQFLKTTCPTSVFLELQDSYLRLLCLSLPWAVSDHRVHTEKPPAHTAGACFSSGFLTGHSEGLFPVSVNTF